MEERGQFYLHQFVDKQPDLNYRNQLVIDEITSTYEYWMDLGVDGFRVDAVSIFFYLLADSLFMIYVNQVLWMMEDEQLLDEPESGFTDDPDDYGYLNHIYTYNQPETRDILSIFHQTIKDYSAANGYDRCEKIMPSPLPMHVFILPRKLNLTNISGYFQ